MATSPENWERVKTLFEEAVEREPEQRSAYLQENAGDQATREEVERLLAEHEQAGSFLSSPAFEVPQVQSNQSEHRFLPGAILASRFRVVRFIAAGGMGEVYAAQDLELRENLAIKTIKPEILQQPNALERFKREVHLARKVTHPNVCRVFDLFRCKTEASEADREVVFVSMELLQGESLSERIRRGGCFDPQEALPLIAQISAGLAAAHHVGVVHRDFKPGNVILVPDGDSSQIRAAITDFGLAFRAGGDASLSTDFTTARGIFGTPAYMAPEQIEGNEVTSAADIYALGLVIHEMVTGSLPFASETPLSMLVRRMHEPIPSPRLLMPSLDSTWESAILRCLEREPSKRFGTTEEVVRALRGETQSLAKHRATVLKLKILVPSLAALLALGTALGFYVSRHRTTKRFAESPTHGPVMPVVIQRPTVAVLGFKNLSGRREEDYLSNSLAETIDCELAAGEKVRTIPGENIVRMKSDLALPDAESYAADTLQKIRKNLDTDYVVEGSYLALGKDTGGEIRVNLRLQDTRTGETIASVAETGEESNLNELFAKAGSDLRMKLGVGQATVVEEAAARAALPVNPLAARYYSEGLTKVRAYEALAGRDLLKKAVAAEPSFALSHLALAAAWSSLGYQAKNREESKKAYDLSGSLSREQRLVVEAHYRETITDWTGAITDLQKLYGFFSDNLDYGLQLARDQISAGKARDGLATLASIRRLPSPLNEDPRIDYVEGIAGEKLGDYELERSAGTRAAEKARDRGNRVLQAWSLKLECWATYKLGQPGPAMTLCQQAKQLFSEAGYRNAAATILISIGVIQFRQDDAVAAKLSYKEALAVCRQVGDRGNVPVALNNLANIYFSEGDLSEAKATYKNAAAGYREIGDKRGLSIALDNMGNVLQKQGDLTASQKKHEEALAVARGVGNNDQAAIILSHLSDISYIEGDLANAKKRADEALAIDTHSGNKRQIGSDLFEEAVLSAAAGNLTEARAALEQVLTLRNGIGAKGDASQAMIVLAQIDLEETHPDKAESAARDAIAQFHSEKRVEDEVTGLVVLGEALLAEGQNEKARDLFSESANVIHDCSCRETLIGLAITQARVQAALGKTADAISKLKSTTASAAKLDFVPELLEARLALGEIETKSGNAAEGRTLLAALEKVAATKGFLLIARKAHADQQ